MVGKGEGIRVQEVTVKSVWPGTMSGWPDGGQGQRTVTFLGEEIASKPGPLPKEIITLFRTPNGYKVVYREDGGRVIYPAPDSDYTAEDLSREFPEF